MGKNCIIVSGIFGIFFPKNILIFSTLNQKRRSSVLLKCHLSLFTSDKASILTLPLQSPDSPQSIRLRRRWPALASWAVRLADSRRAGGGFDPHWFEPVSDTALQGEHDWRQAGLLAAEGRPRCPLHGTFTTAEKEGGLREWLNLCKEADKAREEKERNPSHYLNGKYSQLGGLWPTDLSNLLSLAKRADWKKADR